MGTPCVLVPYLLFLLVVNIAHPLSSAVIAINIIADFIMILTAHQICSTLAASLGNCNDQYHQQGLSWCVRCTRAIACVPPTIFACDGVSVWHAWVEVAGCLSPMGQAIDVPIDCSLCV